MKKEAFTIKPVGDRAVLTIFGEEICPQANAQIMALAQEIQRQRGEGIIEIVPSFAALLVGYDPLVTTCQKVSELIQRLAASLGKVKCSQGKIVEIPVCYGGSYGEDLPFVAEHAGLTEQEVIDIHSGRTYLIYMLGFLPGFPYLGGLDERLFTPRLATPRTKIPEGAVGIGGEQTGIYPMESPGGWQLIGRTPLKLFDPGMEKSLYQPGDSIRFVPIGPDTFEKIYAKERGGR